MPLKHLPSGWCGQNMKAIAYMLNPLGWCGRNMKAIPYILFVLRFYGLVNPMSYTLHTSAVKYTFQNLNRAVNDKV